MSESSNNDTRTIGEQLYLVHLNRFNKLERNADDFDHEETTKEPRGRSFSAGEELWQVHLRRSAGLEPDDDKEEDAIAKRARVGTPESKTHKKRKSTRVIHLRNRNIKVPLPSN
jgi:hypothetical protein